MAANRSRVLLFVAAAWMTTGELRAQAPRAPRAAAAARATAARTRSAPPARSVRARAAEEVAPPAPSKVFDGPVHESYDEGGFVPYESAYLPDEEDCAPCEPCYAPPGEWLAGFEFSFFKPHFENNVAVTRTREDQTTFSATETPFEYDLDLAPRVWLHWVSPVGTGARVRYQTFEHEPDEVIAQPDADVISEVAAPFFSPFDQAFVPSTTVAGERITASSELEFNIIDLEGTKRACFEDWALMASGGLRYASIDQEYIASLRDVENVLVSQTSFSHRFVGLGPTISIEARRPFGCHWRLFSSARGSVVFGDGESHQTTATDLDLTTPTNSNLESERDDVLTIGELQVGVEWVGEWWDGGHLFCRTTLEGQVWQGAGSANTEDGDMGLFGFSFMLGVTL